MRITDITIGQYYKVDSLIHRMDPRTKLLATILYMVMLFMCDSVITYGLAFLWLVFIIVMSKVPVSFIVRGLKSIVVLLVFSAAMNLFFASGEVVWEWKFLHITKEGIGYAVQLSVRLIMLIIGSSILTLTTTPTALCDGIETGLGFLNRIHVPVHEIAMMISIALRFIPILMEEADKIMKAQTARGADFESGGLWKRIMSMIPLLVPLFVCAIRRATELARAMEARCYQGGVGRTKMYPLEYHKRDYVAYVTLAGYLALVIVCKNVF